MSQDDYDIVFEVFRDDAPAEVPLQTRIGFLRRMAHGFVTGTRERNEDTLRTYADVLKRIPTALYEAVYRELVSTWRDKFWPYPAHILDAWDRAAPPQIMPETPAMSKERARARARANAYGWLKGNAMGQVALQCRVGGLVVRQWVDKGKIDWTEDELRRLAMNRARIRRDTLDDVRLERNPVARAAGQQTWSMLVDGQDAAEEELAREYLRGYVPKGEAVATVADEAAATG